MKIELGCGMTGIKTGGRVVEVHGKVKSLPLQMMISVCNN
jgi:hypothetical protein